ncbi:MAG: hypothetical protein P8078_13555 [bacterium]
MKKILRKYTTVPPELYVHRDADRQLRNIIDEMERPGYILVARQMGKTNLLLNAKRELEDRENIFSYIDLSVLYNSSRECFRGIIDTIVETHKDLFGTSLKQILDCRRTQELPPHKEYERELTILLNAFEGRIIILLDEIDALLAVDFSDQIFAHLGL